MGRHWKIRNILRASRRKNSPVHGAVEHLLYGPEVHLPDGYSFNDKEGKDRTGIRTRWWDMKPGLTFGEVCMPAPMDCPHPLLERHLERCRITRPTRRRSSSATTGCRRIARAVRCATTCVCLDFCAGLGGPLVACRWNGPE